MDDDEGLPGLLTEAELATKLRCSQSKIKRLRRSGKLAYLRGRPVLIEPAAVDAYLRSIRQEAVTPAPKAIQPSTGEPEIGSAEYEALQRQKIITRVRQARVKLHFKELRHKKGRDGK
ncbi:MAG: helix-turn-helix domain-containing protein [Mesorhizobium sp.]|uniref:helix-turn-helix domain-containing protein n=1 Tax=Mesorhizobium sp. TaxID=1871066 RepID=UPI0012081B6F|nr:helix-turn-helix domain-containing protein [Mesorhizobium sp.]TIP24263.1 MAG: helix-turn-helix domain-containing protein [Mesorhizobium sp.]